MSEVSISIRDYGQMLMFCLKYSVIIILKTKQALKMKNVPMKAQIFQNVMKKVSPQIVPANANSEIQCAIPTKEIRILLRRIF